ncbi:MAG: hypothetical protein N3A60_02500 [Thermanaerothrix sp.]|nr:hypothetical protein [Thermanaerothrix sp.]
MFHPNLRRLFPRFIISCAAQTVIPHGVLLWRVKWGIQFVAVFMSGGLHPAASLESIGGMAGLKCLQRCLSGAIEPEWHGAYRR